METGAGACASVRFRRSLVRSLLLAGLLLSGCDRKANEPESPPPSTETSEAPVEPEPPLERAAEPAPVSRAAPPASTEPNPEMVRQLEVAKEDLENAAQAAEAARARELVPSDLLRAAQSLARANEAQSEGRWRDAVDDYLVSAKQYRDAKENAEQLARDLQELEDILAQYRTLREEALALGIAADSLAEQDAEIEQVRRYKESRSGLLVARTNGLQVLESLGGIIGDRRKGGFARHEAEELRRAVTQMRALAKAAEIERHAPDEFRRAELDWQLAEKAWADGDHGKALGYLKSVKSQLEAAIALAEERKGGEEVAAGGDAPEDEPASDPNVPASQPSTPEDLAITEELARKLHGEPKYAGGKLYLVYELGADLRNDVTLMPKTEPNVTFDGPFGYRVAEKYAVAGHTQGQFLVNAEFEDAVTVRCTVRFELLTEDPQFQIVLMSDGKGFYSSNFGVDIEQWSKGARAVKEAPANKQHRANPSKWVNRNMEVTIELRSERDPSGEGMLVTAVHRGKVAAQCRLDKFRKGRIGLLWDNVRFMVTKLEIEGTPAPEWLAAMRS